MSAPFPKRPPAVLMAGNDVRSIRPWLNSVRDSVASLADFCRSLSRADPATAHPQDVRPAGPFVAWVGVDPAGGSHRAYCKGGRIDIPADGVKLTCADLADDDYANVGYGDDYGIVCSITFGEPSTAALAVVGSSGWEDLVGWPASPYATYGFLVATIDSDLNLVQHQRGSILWAKPAKGSIIALASGVTAPPGYLLCDGNNSTTDLVGYTIHGLPGGGNDGDTTGATEHQHTATLTGFTADNPASGASWYAHTSDTLTTATASSFQPSRYLRYYQHV